MLLYNVTINIDLEAREEWLHWMQTEHIPDVMMTGCFESYRFSKMLDHGQEDVEIYTAQYLVKSRAMLLKYQQEFAPELQKETKARFEGRFAAFRSLMEIVDHNEKTT